MMQDTSILWSLFLFVLPLAMGAATVAILMRAEGTRFEIRGVVAPYFVSVSFVFCLLASLVTSDVWSSIGKMTQLVDQEGAALRAMMRSAQADPSGESLSRMRPLVQEFIRLELAYRGADLRSARENSREVEELSVGVYAHIADPRSFGGDNVLRANALSKFEAVREARFQRLALATDRVAAAKMALLLVTGFLTQIAIAMVHAGARRPMIAAMALFSVTFSLLLGALDFFQTHRGSFDLVSWHALELALR